MKRKCNYKGAQPYWDWTQGQYAVINVDDFLNFTYEPDAPDFFHSSVLDNDPVSGLGGWGDPEDDNQITTGGFSRDFSVAYPSPHRVRRDFDLQPFVSRGDFTFINTTYSQTAINKLLTSYDGDFVGFQTFFESVRTLLSSSLFFIILTYMIA
jgi:tyrosinase